MENAPAPANPLIETALKSMADIVLPPPVSYLPQTWGWAALAVLLLALAAMLAWHWHRRWRLNRYRREALAELRALDERTTAAHGSVRFEQDLAALMKRTALAAWPREQVANLTAGAWTTFLADHADDGKLDATLATLLSEDEYTASIGKPAEKRQAILVAAARRWIEGHHVSA